LPSTSKQETEQQEMQKYLEEWQRQASADVGEWKPVLEKKDQVGRFLKEH
jgi:hypothetical protein